MKPGNSARLLTFIIVPALLALVTLIVLPGGESPASVRIAIEGMTCAGCASTVGKAVAGLEGVGETSVNVEEGYADVVFASSMVSTDDIVRAIADAGYAAAPVPDPGEAVQKPGDTPVPNAKLDDIRARLAKTKNGLMMEGKYSCCIAPSCDFCAMAMNGCPCGDNLAKGKPVCAECKGGWTAGYGTNPDIDPKDVKALPDEEMKKLYKSRSELIKKSKLEGGDKK